MKFALIATDHNDARRWAEEHAARGFAIITPRSRDGARGMSLAAVWATDAAREHPRFHDLLEDVAPAVCTAPPVVLANRLDRSP